MTQNRTQPSGARGTPCRSCLRTTHLRFRGREPPQLDPVPGAHVNQLGPHVPVHHTHCIVQWRRQVGWQHASGQEVHGAGHAG